MSSDCLVLFLVRSYYRLIHRRVYYRRVYY